MSLLPSSFFSAVERLRSYYNGDPYDPLPAPAGNPGGFAGIDGMDVNYVACLRDVASAATGVADAAVAAADQAEAALSSAASAATSAASAATSATSAATSAGTATAKAGEVAASATSAATSAGTATAKAGEAAASATSAATSAGTATAKAGEAAASATSAATSASTATAKAGEAAASATSAATSASTATAKATAAAASATSAAIVAGQALSATSVTPLTIGAAPTLKTLTVQSGKGFAVGQYVTITYSQNKTNWFYGYVTAYNTTSGELSVQTTLTGGSGYYSDWIVAVSGPRGPQGDTTMVVAVNGGTAVTRPAINFIAGTGAEVLVTDNASANRVDVTITASGPVTFDPSKHGSDVALSPDWLTATAAQAHTARGGCRITSGRASGKYYFEVVGGFREGTGVGLAAAAADIPNIDVLSADGIYMLVTYPTESRVLSNGMSYLLVGENPYGDKDLSFYCDLDARKWWRAVNGVLQGGGNPLTGVNSLPGFPPAGIIYPVINIRVFPGEFLTIRLHPKSWKYPPLAGFGPW